jgi:putative OPT family oligopeptide transporter
LKTGAILGATPRALQIAQLLGAVVPALILAPTLSLLHHAYGIGDKLKAPQATLFASLTKAIFGDGTLPMDKIWIGAGLGVAIIILDRVFFTGKRFRLHLMPIAVGIYLPVTLATPMVLGGVIQYMVKKRHPERDEGSDPGVLLSSGLVAGEALMGVVVAGVIALGITASIPGISSDLQDMLSVAALFGLALYLLKKARA